MVPLVKLTPAVLKSLCPSQTLTDLLAEPHDLENDLGMLLDWLLPYYPLAGSETVEPLARVRAAARRCLRDKLVHQEFVRLFLNSISVQFHHHFEPFVASNTFISIVEQVATLSSFYRRQISLLDLSLVASDVFSRGLASLFLRCLNRSQFLLLLDDILSSLYNEKSRTWLNILAAIGMKPIIQETAVRISAKKISQHIASVCSGKWDKQLLVEIEEWVRVDLYPIFALGCVDLTSSSSNDLVRNARDELISLRISEIFSMVVAFPQSEIALGELHLCLSLDSGSQAQHRAKLVDTFTHECQARLLHLGSNTTGITQVYIKTIKSFLLVDPTGVLLDKVARPIRKYLKSRMDLVPQLVRGMLDLNPETNPLVELAQELNKGITPFSAPIDDLTDLNWYPDPIDALPDFKKGRVLDVVEALTGIFSLLGVFVEEFTRLFGDRLLQWGKYNVMDILNHVELLKARFGVNEFATLDVMVRDIQESAAINSRVMHEQLSLTILSKIYWPTVADSLSDNDYFNVPVDDGFEAYCGSFRSFMPGRDLALIPSLGTVTVELLCEHGSQEYEVTPAQATVIELFHDDMDEMALLTISLATRMSSYTASQALKFWVGKGILSGIGDVYKAVHK
ncbi:hypothetical protein METBIDRAFT_13417 [Metschnikowia bicuspidata var. bicuspidata NRRL YB-4993]|uniref:Cullin family profile domain-containing protein n=1 Tax=Metschnikowia bicuspidata var. bicuspidata NRRL YB-4993 TaxID=869754 RepID=A0A1A0H6M4_9ASCO|nr:hypothetical protein METBIDRAFT_13417 [Metschnikowia bicuspidata var. bicuspidata NRRL YB-4993]OBA19676.1 hypothetical protein METBIDRAFT_13417 [Metschnikowia bicuspidata var. bicuspidata NRRL YB-4993]